jgi:hypothetical protein
MQDNGNTAHEPERASPEKSQPREAAGVQRQKAGKGQATQEPRVPREDIRLLVIFLLWSPCKRKIKKREMENLNGNQRWRRRVAAQA